MNDLLASTMTRPLKLPGANDRCWCGSGQKYKRCHMSRDAELPPARPRLVMPGVVSPLRPVPGDIPRPEYAASGRPTPSRGSEVKTPEQIARMRKACRAAAQVLARTAAALRPGITTDALDAIAHAEYIRLGGYPSTLNYHGFPKSICTSVNEVICHGIPDSRPLEEGDIVNLDVTIYLDGMHGDCSATYGVGTIDEASKRLVQVTHASMMKGIEAVRPGRPVSDIGKAIQPYAERHGYGVVRAYCGHGIGDRFHTTLQIPHYYDPASDTIMEPGMTFTVEPMITMGDWDYRVWDDGWTAVTADGQRTAQFEHTVLVTENGVEILTTV